jgi:FKBP-type peptidyl-prolyl cis-trans isomerase FkpA/FKBP-type peptidyl-prolyl cis-trans isomerase FklB
MRAAIALALALVLVGAPALAQGPTLKTEDDKTLYALGLLLSRSLANFNLTEAELANVLAGVGDGVRKKEQKVDLQAYGPKVQALHAARMAAASEGEKKTGEAFLAKAAGEKGATKTPSGLVMTTVKPGTGASPSASDTVKVHYHGTLTDGTVFDSSVDRKEPATFPLNRVIPCWTEGVQKMKVGGKSRFVCPPALAYGDQGAPPKIKPGATLVFDVELLEIVKQ